jgi:NAD(P)-dependent dehydrogenase (short-subunit alcohol dehydrogenase family)
MKAEQLFDISGRIAFVTGAASGLGLAMAEVMAANGAQVTLADVDAVALEAEVARLRAAAGSTSSSPTPESAPGLASTRRSGGSRTSRAMPGTGCCRST